MRVSLKRAGAGADEEGVDVVGTRQARRRFTTAVSWLAVVALLLPAWSTAGADGEVPLPPPVHLELVDVASPPPEVRVAPGTTVTWHVADDEPHSLRGLTVGAGLDPFAVGEATTGGPESTISHRFDELGEHWVFCELHGGAEQEVLAVVIVDDALPLPTPAPEPTTDGTMPTDEDATPAPEPTDQDTTPAPEPTDEDATPAPEPTDEDTTPAPEPTDEDTTPAPEPTAAPAPTPAPRPGAPAPPTGPASGSPTPTATAGSAPADTEPAPHPAPVAASALAVEQYRSLSAAAPVAAVGGGFPAQLKALQDSVVRSGPSGTRQLLAEYERHGIGPEEAVRLGFGRFPVGGVATYTHDWWFPRHGPGWRLHQGTDIFAARGTPVRAPADGRISVASGGLGGLSVKVTQADGTYWYLAHLEGVDPAITEGMEVAAGTTVGYVGDSGNARGGLPHLHLEVHPGGGAAVDPKPILDQLLAEALAAVPEVVALAGASTPAPPSDLQIVDPAPAVTAHERRPARVVEPSAAGRPEQAVPHTVPTSTQPGTPLVLPGVVVGAVALELVRRRRHRLWAAAGRVLAAVDPRAVLAAVLAAVRGRAAVRPPATP